MHPSILDFSDRPITLSFEKRHYLDQCDMIDPSDPHTILWLYRRSRLHWLLYSIWVLTCSRSHRPCHPRAAVIQFPTVWQLTPSPHCKGRGKQQNSELNASTDFTIGRFSCEIVQQLRYPPSWIPAVRGRSRIPLAGLRTRTGFCNCIQITPAHTSVHTSFTFST